MLGLLLALITICAHFVSVLTHCLLPSYNKSSRGPDIAWNLLEMQLSGSMPDLLNQKLSGVGPRNLCFNKPTRWFYARSSSKVLRVRQEGRDGCPNSTRRWPWQNSGGITCFTLVVLSHNRALESSGELFRLLMPKSYAEEFNQNC